LSIDWHVQPQDNRDRLPEFLTRLLTIYIVMKPPRILFLTLATALVIPSPGWGQTLNYAVFTAPPFMILDETDGSEALSGIDVDIVREVARRMKLNLRFVNCPWARCLRLLKDGHADLLSSAYKKPDREVFLNYFAQPYLSALPIAFYSKQSRNYSIEKYEDLYRFKNIGVLSGASYFERFDKDQKLSKYEVPTQDQLFPMLVHERFDLFAGYVPTENYRLIAEGYKGQVQRSKYEFSGQDAVYMAVSKKSPLAHRLKEFNLINDELTKTGFINQTIEKYYTRYLP
jgi:polar amino acid transport system substrate-binding protein